MIISLVCSSITKAIALCCFLKDEAEGGVLICRLAITILAIKASPGWQDKGVVDDERKR
jgi:hypothetical protein